MYLDQSQLSLTTAGALSTGSISRGFGKTCMRASMQTNDIMLCQPTALIARSAEDNRCERAMFNSMGDMLSGTQCMYNSMGHMLSGPQCMLYSLSCASIPNSSPLCISVSILLAQNNPVRYFVLGRLLHMVAIEVLQCHRTDISCTCKPSAASMPETEPCCVHEVLCKENMDIDLLFRRFVDFLTATTAGLKR